MTKKEWASDNTCWTCKHRIPDNWVDREGGGKMYNQLEKKIVGLGEKSKFFSREGTDIPLGELIKVYRYAPQTFVEKYQNGFILYHLGNIKKYRKEEAKEVFNTAKDLAVRERMLNRMFGW